MYDGFDLCLDFVRKARQKVETRQCLDDVHAGQVRHMVVPSRGLRAVSDTLLRIQERQDIGFLAVAILNHDLEKRVRDRYRDLTRVVAHLTADDRGKMFELYTKLWKGIEDLREGVK